MSRLRVLLAAACVLCTGCSNDRAGSRVIESLERQCEELGDWDLKTQKYGEGLPGDQESRLTRMACDAFGLTRVTPGDPD